MWEIILGSTMLRRILRNVFYIHIEVTNMIFLLLISCKHVSKKTIHQSLS